MELSKGLKTITALLFFSVSACQSPDSEKGSAFYVAPDGNDANPGTLKSPFATLETARNAIRTLKEEADSLPHGGVTVYIREGTYQLPAAFELKKEDSGRKNTPVTYTAYENEEVLFTGAFELDKAAFEKVSDMAVLQRLPGSVRDKIVQIDLKAQGIDEFGKLESYGMGLPAVTLPPELFFNGETMTLARWPNEDYVHTGQVIDTGSIPRNFSRAPNDPAYVPPKERYPLRGAAFHYEGNRPSRWINTEDIWMFGFWWFDWADATLQAASIDTTDKIIETVQPSRYGVRSGQRYYFFNILEEIDSPGEWYLDRNRGILYFYPPAALENASIQLSILDEELFSLQETSHITLEKLKMGNTRANGIVVRGGSHNTIAGCTVFRTGEKGIIISGTESQDDEGELGPEGAGTHNRVISCNIYETGTGGVVLAGGNRKTLTPGNNQAINNHIHHYERIVKTYTPAISLQGVGNLAAHNLIHDAPHFAISYSGNDHIIEFNEIHHVVEESSDAGAIYNGRNPTEAGNIIRYNFFHHIGNDLGGYGQQSIFLDDGASFHHIYGNVFYKAGSNAVFKIHGGQHNVFENNIIVDSPPAAGLHLWGENWEKWLLDQAHGHGITAKLEAVNIKQPPYSSRYPKLATILEDGTPVKSNKVVNNLIVSDESEVAINGDGSPSDEVTLKGNFITDQDPGFVDAGNMNFQLKDDAIVYDKIPGFAKIPFDSIGLYSDPYRKNNKGK